MTKDHEAYFRLWKDRVNAELVIHVPAKNPATHLVSSAMRYAVQEGNRWRPLLLISAYELSTGRAPSEVLPSACAIELVHCCTLMLDDLPFVDNAVLRRGGPACHVVFGEAATVYASHLLFSLAERIARENATTLGVSEEPVWDHLIKLREQLVAAQEIEINLTRGNLLPDEDIFARFYKMKCSPFISATWLAATLGGIELTTREALTQYAMYLGMAYQLADDIADVEGEPSEMGKSTGMDENKVNLVSAFGVNQAKERALLFVSKAKESLDSLPFETKILASLMNRIVGPGLGAPARTELQHINI